MTKPKIAGCNFVKKKKKMVVAGKDFFTKKLQFTIKSKNLKFSDNIKSRGHGTSPIWLKFCM